MKIKDVLKRYDKQLGSKRHLDGSLAVYRSSPFNITREHELFRLKNMHVGSAKWIRIKLIKMDTQRFDLTGEVLRHNKKIKEDKGDKNMSEDLADFFEVGESFVT